jgi:hypothetical protein
VDRPPDQPAQRRERNLERDEEEEHRPLHGRRMLLAITGSTTSPVPDGTSGS